MGNKLTLIILISLLAFSFKQGNSQSYQELPLYEQQISVLFDSLRKSGGDKVKMEVSQKIVSLFDRILQVDSSFYYPFDSLLNMGKIYSSDELVRVYSWNVPLKNGMHKYAGFVQSLNKKRGSVHLVFLNNVSGVPPEITRDYDASNWYGALYYRILRNECEGEVSYILLGFRFNNFQTNTKIIEFMKILDDNVHFGSPVFHMGKVIKNRVVFEYSARVAMMLRYDDELRMIVFDHLSPTEPQYEGEYQFYGPDFSYDGFKPVSCYWELVEDLDLKNKLK